MKKYLWIIIPVAVIYAYMKIPAFKNFVDGLLGKKKTATVVDLIPNQDITQSQSYTETKND